MRTIKLGFLLVLTLLANSAIAKDSTLSLPDYVPVENKNLINGLLTSAGSTTVSPILEAWFKRFVSFYPAVEYKMSAAGSGTAPKALMDGSAMIGAMSRAIKDKEAEAFKALKYYKPTEIRVTLDALGVIVNPLNPLKSISQTELDAIYSTTRNCGYPDDITDWKVLGWDIPQKLEVHFIHPNAGGSGFFSKKTLCGGEYKDSKFPLIERGTVMIETVSKSRFSIGISSMTKMNNTVKRLKVGKTKQHPGYLPTATNITNNKYPLTRYLYLYIDKRPDTELPNHLREFIKFIFSRQGQQISLVNGGFPLSPAEIGDQLDNLLN